MSLKTPWTDSVNPDCPLPEYPRPQMARRSWLNLNGRWECAFSESSRQPNAYDGTIIVPFSPETELSGVNRALGKNEYLWYRRSFKLPEDFKGKRILLHFDAVDRDAYVWVNGDPVIRHIGGYLPFSAEITDCLDGNEITIVVRVSDDTDASYHTRGKQKTKRGGIWYTPQSGIWQTVWLEAVPDTYIKQLKITPNFDEAYLDVSAEVDGGEPAYAVFNRCSYELPAKIPVPDFVPWSPENPRLYGFSVFCGEDEVRSYFAMRKIHVAKDNKGVPRLFLNNEPYFQNGLLDQGYWPDGLYTPATDEAMIYDISMAKAMGFNMLRKHIKVEPLRWYYHCDRYGMLVWQDMPNGGGNYNPLVVTAPVLTGLSIRDRAYGLFGRKSYEGREEFKQELLDMVEHLYNCPCIVMWVPFNEGWGQFDAHKIYELVSRADRSRIVDHASGWHDQGVGKVRSHHIYFRPYKFKLDKNGRAVLLSEFGGYSHQVLGHCFNNKYFGYKKFETPAQLEFALENLYQNEIAPAYRQGLSAAVYTQLSDVEDELNGLLSYDRCVVKIAPEIMKDIVSVE